MLSQTERSKMSKESIDNLYDNSRIVSYKTCPRMFYLRHIRDWTKEGKAYPLLFGTCWHAAMDSIFKDYFHSNIKEPYALNSRALEAFHEAWKEEKGPDFHSEEVLQELGFRNPYVAAEMLQYYIPYATQFFKRYVKSLISIEEGFKVPLYKNDAETYIGRFDKVLEMKNGTICAIEHKTTSLYSRASGIRPLYLESFNPNSQIDGQFHALHSIYGDRANKIIIDIALVHKTEHDIFRRLPLHRSFEMLDSWLYETRLWVERIEEDKETLLEEIERKDPILKSFPRNTSACQLYGKACQFADICRYNTSPHLTQDVPIGFVVDHWDPLEHISTK